jgi:hypothetical protein
MLWFSSATLEQKGRASSMIFNTLDASAIRSSIDGYTWTLGKPSPRQAYLLEHGFSQLPSEHMSYEDFEDYIVRYVPSSKHQPGDIDWITAWRYHQLGIAGFEMIRNELVSRPNGSFRLDDPEEANNPIWGVISNRRFEFEGGDPIQRHVSEN